MMVFDAVRTMLRLLEERRAEYLLVGALAVGVWGIARSTQDADFVVAVPGLELEQILQSLPAEFSVDPQPQVELFTGTW